MEHIILLTTSFPDERPGSEAAGSFVADFAEELSRYVRVTVLAPGVRANAESHEHLTIERFAVPRLPLSLLKPGNPADWINIAKTMRGGQKAIDQISSEKQADHILALWALPSGYWARNVSKKHDIPYSVWALGSDIWTLGRIPMVKNLLNAVLRDSYKCFADGHLLKQDVESLSGRRCEFLPSTRKLPSFVSKHVVTRPPYRLAYLGRWHPNKGVDLLLASLSSLDDEDWHNIAEIRICGGGPLQNKIKHSCAALQSLGRPVADQGYLDKLEAAELLAWTDYLIIPSRIESIPVVFSDAMQARCAVIATPVGDLPRLINEYKVGILASDVSANALTIALRNALRQSPSIFQSGLIDAMSQFNIRNTVEHFLGSIFQSPSAN
jgi:glycosyltransferase involved in cell wall biosynthesis